MFDEGFSSSEVALYLHKSTRLPCTEYCCHVLLGPPSCCLDTLDNGQKWVCRTVGPPFADSLDFFAHCWNVASWSLFDGYYFRSLSDLTELVALPYSFGRSTCNSNRLHDFSVTILRCLRMSVTVSCLAALESGILCFRNILWSMVQMALTVELPCTFYLLGLSNHLS